MKNKTNYCSNCGKYGHQYKNCTEPIISLGIICFKYNIENDYFNQIKNYINKKYINIDNFNFENINNITRLNYFKNKIKFLLIRRKNTLNYIEFLRGKYEKNDINKLNYMFNLMTNEEINKIKNNDFDFLWNELWKKTSNLKIYQKEFRKSKNKFNYLKKNKILDDLTEIVSDFEVPEWGFPKGRRNNFEKNIDCALREFSEETNLDIDRNNILNNLDSIQENYTGTNGKNYKHIYYLSLCDNDTEVSISEENKNQNYEIGDIGWYSWHEAVSMIRPYYKTKIDLLNRVFLFSMNIYYNYIKNPLSKNINNNLLI